MDSAEPILYDARKVTATNVTAILLSKHCDPDVNNGVVQLRNAVVSSSQAVVQRKHSRIYGRN